MDRDKALHMALDQIEKQFGKGAVMRMGDQVKVKVGIIPTGALSLDIALGVGGLPRGRVVEIYGPESSGKTTVALHAIAEAQRAGGIAAFIDAEHALDPTYAAALGVDVEALLVSQPDTGEQALEITDMLVRSGAVDIVVIDSVAALTPRAELEGEMGDTHVGLQARLMSQALRKLAGTLNRSRTCCVFINQLREKVGVLFGSPEVTPGGRALKFYSSVRLDVRRIESLKDGTTFVGNRVRVKVVKNKCVAAGTRVFDPLTGLTHHIEDIVDHGAGSAVWAVDKRGELHVCQIGARFDQGEQAVMGITLRDETTLRVTPDHQILTEYGWRKAHELAVGDRVARPRHAGGFGANEPVPPAHARLVGYLIGDGYIGGKTPIAFVNTEQSLHEDARRIASELGCEAHPKPDGLSLSFSHRPGMRNGVLALARWAGIWEHRAPEKRIPPTFFNSEVSSEVVANLLFGIWETDGWLNREQTGGICCGFATTSEQLAWQIHFLLLRWGIASSVTAQQPGSRWSLIAGRHIEGKVPCWQVRVSGIDDIRRFADALPMWGPTGQKLTAELANLGHKQRRGSRTVSLSAAQTEPILAYLRDRGVTPRFTARVLGLPPSSEQAGTKAMLGAQRMRRGRVERLAEALDSAFLRESLADGLYYDRIMAIAPVERRRTFDIEVPDLHNFIADDIVVHNCAPPFTQCEFDIIFGQGISREGSLLDIGVQHGIIKKAGAWYTYDGEQLGQGRENARQFLKEHDNIAAEVYKKVTEQLGLVQTDVTGSDPTKQD